jgi:serine/threonine-protein kinase
MTEKIVGSYSITRSIGQGGMAHVYCAVHRLMEREVALKLILPILLTEEQAQARFLREAKLLAKLEHPCIVPIYDSGRVENSEQLYLAMRLMKGGSLDERLKAQGKLSIGEYLPILRRVVEGLSFAHRHNIVHRDLKPGNILFDGEGLAYLSDFGIAHVAQQTLQMTATGAKLGTPQYMAPEQFEGETIDGRTDQYALAVMSYQVLSGRRPFEADTLIKLMKMHLMDAPPALTLPDSALGERLNGVLQKALAKEPDERYATCADFMKALSSAALDSGTPTQPSVPEATLLEATYIEPESAEPESAEPKPATLPPASEPPRTPAETPYPVKIPTQSRMPLWGWAGLGVLGLALLWALFGRGSGQASQTVSLPATATPRLAEPTNTRKPTQTRKPPTHTPRPTATAQPLGIGSSQLREKDGMLMVYVPAGEFEMGSTKYDDEQPVHTVYLDAYWIDQTEVSFAQFAKFVQASDYRTSAEKDGASYVFDPVKVEWNDTAGVDWQYPQGTGAGDWESLGLVEHPVVHVSWQDAQAYCEWAGAQLPSEAQWEKAARGTDGRTYPWGNAQPNADLLNFGNNIGKTMPVGSYAAGASPYGALDLAGNVWEWVADWYAEGYYATSPARNPKGPSSGEYRVLRGGSWNYDPDLVRTSNRNWNSPTYSGNYNGFRCSAVPAAR